MRTLLRLSFLALLSTLLMNGCGGNDNRPAPDQIPLPNGFQPEGITARGNFIYVGSIPSGAIYKADIMTGAGTVLVPAQTGRAAIGLKIDGRDRLFVAGGATGKAFVYDATTGKELASYILTQAQTFVNDVILADNAAWFTDSVNQVLYRLAIPADGSLGGQEAVTTLPLTGELQFQAGFNLNGIATAGTKLIVVQSNTGLLFTVDPASGVTQRINLGTESVPNGDGLLLEGQTLLVVQNQLNQVAVIDLAQDLASGTVRTRLTNPAFDTPTTIAAAGTSLYAVNARFGVQATADTPYAVTRFNRP